MTMIQCLWSIVQKQKTFRPLWDERLYVSIPRYHPNLSLVSCLVVSWSSLTRDEETGDEQTLSVLTNISLSGNVEMTV
jgi:hypothetical protein